MAEYRTLRSKDFWNKPFIEELEAKAKLLYIYLFTGPHTNNLGIIGITRQKISYETTLSLEEVNTYIEFFEKKKKVVCDPDHNLIFVVNFIEHQCSTSPKIMEGLKKLAPEIESPIIAEALYKRYPDIYDIVESEDGTLSIPYGKGIHTLSIPSGEFGSWKREVGIGKEEVGREKGEWGEEACAPPPPDEVCQGFVNGEDMGLSAPQKDNSAVGEGLPIKILEAYHRILPEGKPFIIWRSLDLCTLKQFYQTYPDSRELSWWEDYFHRVRGSPILVGKEPLKTKDKKLKYFSLNCSWLINLDQYANIMNGGWDSGQPARQKSKTEGNLEFLEKLCGQTKEPQEEPEDTEQGR